MVSVWPSDWSPSRHLALGSPSSFMPPFPLGVPSQPDATCPCPFPTYEAGLRGACPAPLRSSSPRGHPRPPAGLARAARGGPPAPPLSSFPPSAWPPHAPLPVARTGSSCPGRPHPPLGPDSQSEPRRGFLQAAFLPGCLAAVWFLPVCPGLPAPTPPFVTLVSLYSVALISNSTRSSFHPEATLGK